MGNKYVAAHFCKTTYFVHNQRFFSSGLHSVWIYHSFVQYHMLLHKRLIRCEKSGPLLLKSFFILTASIKHDPDRRFGVDLWVLLGEQSFAVSCIGNREWIRVRSILKNVERQDHLQFWGYTIRSPSGGETKISGKYKNTALLKRYVLKFSFLVKYILRIFFTDNITF